MKILSIETSCDETAISIVEAKGSLKNPKFEVLANVTLSQAKIHEKYGGVFPNLAKREHSKNLVPVFKTVLEEANFLKFKKENEKYGGKIGKVKKILEREPELLEQFLEFVPKIEKPKIDKIAVTYGPGLEPTLWVGINFAKALSEIWQIPVIPVNHMEGHISSILPLQNRSQAKSKITFPALALLISGGHTELVLIKKWGDYKVIGQTRDDAVGECFDKVARMLELPYPGGPEISQLAEKARQENSTDSINFPRPMINSKDFDFSFSGLKTSVLYYLKNNPAKTLKQKQQIALALEDAIAEVLISKTQKALEKTGAKSLIIAGGVSANKFLRESIKSKFGKQVKILIPPTELSTDNALMIAMSGYLKILSKKKISKTIRAQGNLSL